MVDWLKVTEHGVLGGCPIEVPHLPKQKSHPNDKTETIQVAYDVHGNELWHLDIHGLVIRAGGQQ